MCPTHTTKPTCPNRVHLYKPETARTRSKRRIRGCVLLLLRETVENLVILSGELAL